MASATARFKSSSFVKSATMGTPCFSCFACQSQLRNPSFRSLSHVVVYNKCKIIPAPFFTQPSKQQQSTNQRLTTASRRLSVLPSTATKQPLASNALAVAFPIPADPPALRENVNSWEMRWPRQKVFHVSGSAEVLHLFSCEELSAQQHMKRCL
jgi:hypothetical protein